MKKLPNNIINNKKCQNEPNSPLLRQKYNGIYHQIIMTAQIFYRHIEKTDPQKSAHLQRLPRVRIAQIVMDYLAYGWSVENMCQQHPYLTLAEAHAAMAYYFDHQEEIEQEIRQEWTEAETEKQQSLPSPFLVRLRSQGIL